ncbi:MAG: PIG-L family deacetylase [Actinomycetota bacterium]|nr:PIG-L family deacetylase [Actinomycetota bacterium]
MTQQQPAPFIPTGGLLPLTVAGPGPATGGPTLLFIHAHPDDETIVTGATMARYAAEGAEVALLTCTRGELGEVIPAELRHLEVGQPGNHDDGLGAVREAELGAALAALGVRQHYWLGSGAAHEGPGAGTLYRDSGMSWGDDGRAQPAGTVLPGSFSRAPLDEVAGHAAHLIRALRPDVVVTYAADGGYGHPDHIRTHQMALRALDMAAATSRGSLPVWQVPLVYTIVSDRPERPLEPGTVLTVVEGDLAAKTEAMRAHRTQITVQGSRYALSDSVWKDISGQEVFQLLGRPGSVPVGRVHSSASRRAAGTPSRPARYAGAIIAGVLAGLLGTALHARALYLQSAELPWGALAALMLVLAAGLYVGLWARSSVLAAVTGLAAYAMVGILTIPHGLYGMIIGNLAGNIWLFGIAVVTPVAVAICGRILHPRRRRTGG